MFNQSTQNKISFTLCINKILVVFLLCSSIVSACAQSSWDPIEIGVDHGLKVDVMESGRSENSPDEQEDNIDRELSVITIPMTDMTPPKDQAPPINMNLMDMMTLLDPCVHIDCGMHGLCINQEQRGICQCDNRYEFNGSLCVPEDFDQDGVDFTLDCDDDNAQVFPQAIELCDEINQDCDDVIDEGACSIWVLEPLNNRWNSYPINPSGSVSAPVGPMKAAWDIESQDLAFVLTENGYHEFRLSSMTWSPERPRTNLFEGVSGSLRHAAFADSVPASHSQNTQQALTETITISILDAGGVKRIWQIKYILAENRFIPLEGGLYNDVHSWLEDRAPEVNQVRASWIDLENNRFILDVNTQDLCDSNGQLSNIYLGLLTSNRLHVLEAGICFQFVPSIPLINSPLALPNAPPFNVIGAAFMHQGALYLFRGD